MNTAHSIPSGFTFASPDEALAALCAQIRPVESERVALQQAVGRILAEPIRADRPSPACDVSAMDGYAIGREDLKPGCIPVAGDIAIGTPAPPLPAGAVLRIVTGACVPEQACAVIRREDCIELGSQIELTEASLSAVSKSANIRRRGENCPAGTVITPAGTLLNPAAIAGLASVGAASPLLYRKVRLAILVTGDEVLPTDASPEPWQLRDSNGPALHAMFSRHAWIGPIALRRVHDELDALVEALRAEMDGSDAIICTGGVSMGQRDFVPAALRAIGGQVVFHRLPQRPGKPVLAAVTASGKPLLGLPGNPVSVLVTATRLALPALRARAGLSSRHPGSLVHIRNHDAATLRLWWFRPVRLVAPAQVELLPTRGSGDIPSVAASDGFVQIPPGAAPDQPVEFYPWGE